MTLTEMREVLERRDIQLTRSLGQNFLHDGNQLRRIVDAAELLPTDNVLEVGPGLGPLTELLLAKANEVFAIEKDARLIDVLCDRFGLMSGAPDGEATPADPDAPNATQDGNEPLPLLGERAGVRGTEPSESTGPTKSVENLVLLHDDALDFLKREKRDWTDWKLIANLPYSVASPILVELAQSPQRPKMLVATLQLEVAQRLMSVADDDDYGVLTLLVQLRYEPKDSFKIPAECFFPSPDVDSACVVLVRRATPLLPEEQHATFDKIVKRAFSQRRKMMLKLLKQDWPVEQLTAAFAELKISPLERAEKVRLEDFVHLTRFLIG